MKHLSVTVTIKSTPEVVWDFITSLHTDDKFLAWHPDHIKLNIIKGNLTTPGSIIYFEEYLGKNKKKLRLICQLTKAVPNSYLEFKLPNPLRLIIPGNGGIKIDKIDGGVSVNIFVNYGIPVPVIEPLFDDLAESLIVNSDDIVKHTQEEMEILKKILEKNVTQPEKSKI